MKLNSKKIAVTHAGTAEATPLHCRVRNHNQFLTVANRRGTHLTVKQFGPIVSTEHVFEQRCSTL